MTEVAFYKNYLQEELAKRCERNPRYSIRAFAKALGLDAGALSRILSGKRIPSYKISQKIISFLDLTPDQQKQFLDSLKLTHHTRGLKRLNPEFSKPTTAPPQELSVDLFRIIADWYHYAILELTFVKGFQGDPRWISKKLGISVAEAKLAVERLMKLELLVEKNGKLVKSKERITTSDKHLTVPALKKHQKQILERAIISLENDSIEKRSMTSMTMAISPELLPIAKKMIEEFTNKLCDFLESKGQKQVYEVGICLYPVQKES